MIDKNVHDLARVIEELSVVYSDDPQKWAKREGLPVDVLHRICAGMYENMTEEFDKNGGDFDVDAIALLMTTFMFGWECGKELGSRGRDA